jgi:hypothetical protein
MFILTSWNGKIGLSNWHFYQVTGIYLLIICEISSFTHTHTHTYIHSYQGHTSHIFNHKYYELLSALNKNFNTVYTLGLPILRVS